MQTIIVSYFQERPNPVDPPSLLGTETFDSIDEAFVPNIYAFSDKLFLTKKFSGKTERRWKVILSEVISNPNEIPVQHHVVLKELRSRTSEVWLPETLRKHSTKATTHLHRGTLVEVDYGFHSAVVKSSGLVKSNKRYSDQVQAGSMPKRRLGIVVQAGGNWVQVVPISSKNPGLQASCFEIDLEALSKMVTFTRQCWAICHMVESISIHRILPPETYKDTQHKDVGRNTNYPSKLTDANKKKLEAALLKGIGQGAYLNYKEQVKEQQGTIQTRNSDIRDLKQANRTLNQQFSSQQAIVSDLQAKLHHATDLLAKAFGEKELRDLDYFTQMLQD